jgi:periplasmic protein TonB
MSLKKNFIDWVKRNIKLIIILSITLLVHLSLLLFYKFDLAEKELRVENKIYKMTDITEFIPQNDKNIVEISRQEKVTEDVIETDKQIKELDIEYLGQHQITDEPKFPESTIKSRIVYPPLANKQGIEGVVFLEVYIDQTGLIRDIKILKDPGYGFAEAAIRALQGLKCIPAKANGIPVAVKYRYPIRFMLKK